MLVFSEITHQNAEVKPKYELLKGVVIILLVSLDTYDIFWYYN